VLIKNAEALERMEKIDTIIVDKTGTLTLGKPRVTGIRPAPGFEEADVLRLAANTRERQRASSGGRHRPCRQGTVDCIVCFAATCRVSFRRGCSPSAS
jgi:magnesium-transporting ATPase (P-type)